MNSSTRKRGKRIFIAARDQQRGWRINWKALITAYAVEGAIIGSTVFAGIQFANKYGLESNTSSAAITVASNNPSAFFPDIMNMSSNWKMMVVGALAFATAELVRLPIIHGLCTTKSISKKILLSLGVIMAMGVTVKSVSQVAEQTFSPRLEQVRDTRSIVDLEHANLNKLLAQSTSATTATNPLTDGVQRLDEEIATLNKTLQGIGAPPPQKIKMVPQQIRTTKKKNGKWRYKTVNVKTYIDVPWEGKAIVDQIEKAQALRAEAIAHRDTSLATVANRDELVATQRTIVAQADQKYLEAVGDSQLHSFTGMVFGKDPRDVTEAEVHWFLRLFVFFPAIAVALSSSLLAISAYEGVKRRRPIPVELQMNAADGTVAQFINDMVHNETVSAVKAVKAETTIPTRNTNVLRSRPNSLISYAKGA